MLIHYEEAYLLGEHVTEEYLKGLEEMVHTYTNNPFVNYKIKFGIQNYNDTSVTLVQKPFGLRVGDTIQISGSIANDGRYTVGAINNRTLTFQDANLYEIPPKDCEFLLKVEYPTDVVLGVKKLIEYDAKMGSKLGIKSESISRVSITYYDVNASETIEGYPASLLSFLNKYKMLRW